MDYNSSNAYFITTTLYHHHHHHLFIISLHTQHIMRINSLTNPQLRPRPSILGHFATLSIFKDTSTHPNKLIKSLNCLNIDISPSTSQLMFLTAEEIIS